MKPHIIYFGLAMLAVGIIIGLVIAIVISANIMQMDFYYPAGRMLWA